MVEWVLVKRHMRKTPDGDKQMVGPYLRRKRDVGPAVNVEKSGEWYLIKDRNGHILEKTKTKPDL